MSDWTPPKDGTPCWVETPALDVSRAKEFYAKVFNWKFKPAPTEGPYTEDKIAMFGYPDENLKSLGGGIVKAEESKIRKEKGGTIVYLYVGDIEATLEKVKEAGGKPIGEKYAEGDFGWIHDFEDTEGNFCGMYTSRKEK